MVPAIFCVHFRGRLHSGFASEPCAFSGGSLFLSGVRISETMFSLLSCSVVGVSPITQTIVSFVFYFQRVSVTQAVQGVRVGFGTIVFTMSSGVQGNISSSLKFPL